MTVPRRARMQRPRNWQAIETTAWRFHCPRCHNEIAEADVVQRDGRLIHMVTVVTAGLTGTGNTHREVCGPIRRTRDTRPRDLSDDFVVLRPGGF